MFLFFHDVYHPFIQAGTQENIHLPLIARIVKCQHELVEFQLPFCSLAQF
jgi:hypothetical protein